MLLSVRFQLSLRGLKCTSYRCLMLHFRLSVLPNISAMSSFSMSCTLPKKKLTSRTLLLPVILLRPIPTQRCFLGLFLPLVTTNTISSTVDCACLLTFSVGALLYLNKSQSDGLSFAQSICCEGQVAHPHR